MESMNTEEPIPGFLKGVKELAHRNGALFILDEIITGFRYSLGGAQELFNITPDLATFGKSMANGFPISAVVGKRELMKEMEEIFFSFTFGGETISIAAAIATINKLIERSVIEALWQKGEKIMAGVSNLINTNHLQNVFGIKGKPPWSLLMVEDHENATSWEIKSLFKQEMLGRGVLISLGHNLSYAHSDEDIENLLSNYNDVFRVVESALDSNSLSTKLIGKPIEPLFKVR